MDTSISEKIRENRLRRMAERQGFKLVKSRRRDPRALDYGGYGIINPYYNTWVIGANPYAFSMDLDEIEQWLTSDERQ
jgi:hypothetical protein